MRQNRAQALQVHILGPHIVMPGHGQLAGLGERRFGRLAHDRQQGGLRRPAAGSTRFRIVPCGSPTIAV